MLRFFRNSKPKPVGVDYPNAWVRLRNQYADPMTEHATTVQALIVSAASVIDRMWNGNGGTGWDESCDEEYIEPLKKYLVNLDVFSEEKCREILEKLEEIVDCGRENLRGEADTDSRDGETTLLFPGNAPAYLVERTVEWCLFYPEPLAIRDDEEYRGHD
jgi:hypothetical protein